MTEPTDSAITEALWSTSVSDQMYRMLAQPDSKGWATFQSVKDQHRVREWNVTDMRPRNEAAYAVLAKVSA